MKNDSIMVNLKGVKKGDVIFVVIMDEFIGNVCNSGWVSNW